MRSMAKWCASELRHSARRCVMITLTFEGSAVEWTGKACQGAFNAFMTRFKRSYWCRDYLVAREVQERGVYHYHMIVLDVDYLPFDEIDALWGFGFVWLTAFDNPGRAVAYALKYVDKGGRLHASYHLIASLGVRSLVYDLRYFFGAIYRLHEAWIAGVIPLSEWHDGVLAVAACG